MIDENLVKLNKLRKALKEFMTPEVLSKFADLLEEIGKDGSLLERYVFLCDINEHGENCAMAKRARYYFLEESGDSVVELIKWLYLNWAKDL